MNKQPSTRPNEEATRRLPGNRERTPVPSSGRPIYAAPTTPQPSLRQPSPLSSPRPRTVPPTGSTWKGTPTSAYSRRPVASWKTSLVSGCLVGATIIVLLFFLALSGMTIGYLLIARQLPPPEELRTHQSNFFSSKIYDRDGNLLYEVTDPHGGRRTYVTLDRISPYVIQATIATEDRDFYAHPGFDPIAILRAFYYAFSERRVVSGASTIPQQLARNLLLSPEERVQQTASRKIKEIVLATELTRTYPKDTILEIYLNEIYYGNLAYGIQAAAETYFGVNASDLTLAQAAFLAGLPQSPATYDPFAGGLNLALERQETVLALMVEAGYITPAQAEAAAAEMRAYPFKAPRLDIGLAPHFVIYVRQTLEATYGPEALYRGTSLRIYTTLDSRLQRLAEQAVREGVAALSERHVTNGALVAIDPHTGQILAMVGSADYWNEAISGQVNVALRCRQPGSAIKPLTYVASFERGWTPATLFWDVRMEFPDGANPPYVPVNYDGKYHGPMLLRDALANSYNIPAVQALQFVGIEGLLEMATRLGVVSLAHPEQYCPEYPYDHAPTYGLSLTLGGGEVKLLEMVSAFGTFANGGVRVSPNPILRIEDAAGNVLVDYSNPPGEQVISPEHAYLITHILADTQARCRAFRCPSPLQLSRPAAAKSGTTNDYRDGWTIGYTPDLVAGVWVGNADNSAMDRVDGSAGAGPIWHAFMEAAHEGLPVRDFERPPGIVEHEICATSGARPTPYCPIRKREVFAQNQPPLDESHDWYQMVKIDATTGLLANEACPYNVVEQLMLVIKDPRGREWVQAHPEDFGNLPLAPLEYCTADTGQAQVLITHPAAGSVVEGLVPVMGTVQLPDFDHYDVQFGFGENPQDWGWISGPHLAPVRDGLLTVWDTTHLPAGLYTLRVTAFDHAQRRFEGRTHVFIAAPTPTLVWFPTPTFTPTPALPTPSPVPTETPTPVAIFPTHTPTPLAPPTEPPTLPPTDAPWPTLPPFPTLEPLPTLGGPTSGD